MKKRYLYLIIGILVFVIVGLLTYETSSEIVFKKDSFIKHDFGVINKKTKNNIAYDFKYVNNIYDTLKVYRVVDACDCTSSFVKNGEYYKNDTIIVSTKYDPLKYNDKGKIEKFIYLYTNKSMTAYDTILPFKLNGYIQ